MAKPGITQNPKKWLVMSWLERLPWWAKGLMVVGVVGGTTSALKSEFKPKEKGV